jgi:hypothetical protein
VIRYTCVVCSMPTVEEPVLAKPFVRCACVARLAPCCVEALNLHPDEFARVIAAGGHDPGCGNEGGSE